MEGETQDNPNNTQGNQVTDIAGEGAQDTPLSVEELKALVQEQTDKIGKLSAEDVRKEGEIQRLQGITRSLQKQGISPEIVGGLMKRLDDMEMGNAKLLDAFERQGGGEFEQPTTKKTHVQLLEESRTAAKQSQESPQAEPDQVKFIQYMWSQGLDATDPMVLKATENGALDPVTALKNLKSEVKAHSEAEIQRRITEGVQEELKGKGATKGGVKDPSASNAAWRSSSAEGKIRLGVTTK